MTIALLIAGAVCFGLAAANVNLGSVQPGWLGALFVTLSFLL
jgi:hypothetical protein